jgi:hypothetical protein
MEDIKVKMKHVNASSFLKKIAIIIIILLFIFIIFFEIGYGKVLIIFHQETRDVYVSKRVQTGDIVEYYWIHSFEHIPWTEDFEILEDNRLELKKITVEGFGAGIPENKGKVSIEDGIIIMDEIDQYFNEINWINSNSALVYIGLNNNEIIKGSDLPHHEPLKLIVEERLLVWTRFQ